MGCAMVALAAWARKNADSHQDGSESALEGEFNLQPGAERAMLGGRGCSEQVANLVLELARAENLAKAGAAGKHRPHPELLLVESARVAEVLNLAVDLDTGLKVPVQQVARL